MELEKQLRGALGALGVLEQRDQVLCHARVDPRDDRPVDVA